MSRRPLVISPKNAPYRMEVWGQERTRVRSAYHAFLRMSWSRALGTVVVVFVLLNLFFAVLYWLTDGIANARPRFLFDAFAFSVQTLATIGYGYMYPVSKVAHVIVWCEALTGLLLSAVMTGLVFAKFALSGASLVFSKEAVISL